MFAVAVASAMPAGAQVNRCTDAQGRTVYGDQACEATGATRDADTSRRLSGITVERYAVQGTDATTLLADLRRRGPSGFHGMASWNIDYRYNFQTEGAQCRITSVRTTVKGRVLMPQWVDEPHAPKPMREAWQRYDAALIAHEEGHVAHGQTLVRALQRELGGLHAATCDELKQHVTATATRLIEAHKDLDRAYDERTQHGTTQGALLVLP
jgi:predicted secreted Zn-dependent protease